MESLYDAKPAYQPNPAPSETKDRTSSETGMIEPYDIRKWGDQMIATD